MSLFEGQVSPEELHVAVEERLRQLQDKPWPADVPTLSVLEGAGAHTAARGAVRVRPNTAPAAYAQGLYNTVLFQASQTPSPFYIRTTGSRLVKDGQQWTPDEFARPWKGAHLITNETFILQLPENTSSVVALAEDEVVLGKPYDVPPLATKIRGTGLLQYKTGEEVRVDGQQVILRPVEPGVLAVRKGAAYATFYDQDTSRETPTAKVGPGWIRLRKQITPK